MLRNESALKNRVLGVFAEKMFLKNSNETRALCNQLGILLHLDAFNSF